MQTGMSNQLATVRDFLARLIKDAELRETGRHSLTDFATRVRRDTAQEILAFVQSLSAGRATPRENGGVPRQGNVATADALERGA